MSHNNKILNQKEHIRQLENMVNDLTLIVALYDINNPIINSAYRLIGTPINLTEMDVAIRQPQTRF
jgi:hypothetical protein